MDQQHGFGHGFCITLYNEPWAPLQATLVSIVSSLSNRDSAERSRAFICIVADGVDRLSADTLQALRKYELLSAAAEHIPNAQLHVSEHIASSLLSMWDGRSDAVIPSPDLITIIVCLKTCHMGKLNSHELFFETICEKFVPAICYQIDAGSLLGEHAIQVFTRELNIDASISAISPCITPPIPSRGCSFLHAWQYTDFALRQVALLPVESTLDYLAVVPGQASALRWRSLRQNGEEGDPVWAYLHGIGSGSPYRRLMYLSEDRVIGNTLMLDPNNQWKLKYLPAATALTDYCEDYGELLRQRRRWTNSAMLCRLWVAAKTKQLLMHPTRSASSKFRQMLALVLQLTVGLREFCAPAHIIALFFVLARIAASGTISQRRLAASYLVSTVVDFACRALGHRRPTAHWRRLTFAKSTTAWLCASLYIATVATALPGAALVVMVLPFILILVNMTMVLPTKALPVVVRTLFAPVQYFAMSNVILGYSLWNMCDASWGTKGLVHARSENAGGRLLTFRRRAIGVCVLLNVFVLYLATLPGIINSDLNPVVEFSGLLDLGLASTALIALLAGRLKNARVRNGSESEPEPALARDN